MLLPDMFDEKVALMTQEEELSESRGAEQGQGRLIALTPGQMVTFFTTGTGGCATVAPVEVVLDDAKGATETKVSNAISTSRATRCRTHTRPSSTTSLLESSYTPRGTRTTSGRSQPTGGRSGSGTQRAKHELALYQTWSATPIEGDRGPLASRARKCFLFHEL